LRSLPVVTHSESCQHDAVICRQAPMRIVTTAILICLCTIGASLAQESDKKTDDLKPADPDTGESTIEESTLGLLPNPFEKQGVKFAVTYIGEVLGNPTGGQKQSAVYEDRTNFAVDVDFRSLSV
jgi:porin